METIKILPHKGFADVRFGMTQEQVENILGKPDEVKTETYDDGTVETIWEFEAIDADLSFTSDDDERLGAITFYGDNCELYELEFIGVNEDDFLSMTEELDLDVILADHFEDMDAKDYYSDRKGISFWLQDGEVDSITIFPAHDEDDNPIWPQ